jgi:hypothetical protein
MDEVKNKDATKECTEAKKACSKCMAPWHEPMGGGSLQVFQTTSLGFDAEAWA